MAPPSSPVWLPAGWTVQFRVLRNGRKIAYYMNSITGEKFSSKDEVIRHAKKGNPQCSSSDPQSTSGQSSSSDKSCDKQTAVSASEDPEWLPDGWILELRTYQSGRKAGRQYKTYIDPSARFKFYSKPEVLRYLKTAKKVSPISGQEKHESPICNQEKQESPVSDREEQENPISDQEKQDSSIGDREKKESPISNQEKFVDCTSKVRIEEDAAAAADEDLPPGWVKTVKIRKRSRKKDPYFTGPVTDYVFRSKRDVFRFLKTGEISRNAFLPNNLRTPNQKCADDKITPLPAAKVRSRENRTDKISNAKANNSGESTKEKDFNLPQRSSKRLAGAKPELVGFDFALETVPRSSKAKADTVTVLAKEVTQHLENNPGMVNQVSTEGTTQASSEPCLKPVAKKTSIKEKKHSLPHRLSKRLARLAPDVGANSLSGETPPVGLASDNLTGDSSNATSVLRQGSANKSEDPLPEQAFPIEKRQKLVTENEKSEPQSSFLSDPCLEFAIKTLTGAIPLEDAVNGTPVSAPDTKIGETVVQSGNGEKTALGTSKSKKMKKNKDLNLPRRSSKRIAELASESDADSFSGKQARSSCNIEAAEVATLTSEKMANGSFGGHDPGTKTGLWHDSPRALLEELSTKSEGLPRGDTFYARDWIKVDDEKLSNKKSGPELGSPVFDSWYQPSLEFAVKTLTGAASLEEATTKWLVFGPAPIITPQVILQDANTASARKMTTSRNSNKSKPRKKKELDSPHQSSKRRSKQATELVMNSLPAEHTSYVVRGISCDEKGKEPLEAQTVPSDQRQEPNFEKINYEKSQPEFLFPSGDTWSDPCLEFAFKTLTGAISMEDNVAVQDYFQQQLDPSTTKKDGNFTVPAMDSLNFTVPDANFTVSPQQVPIPPSPCMPPANVSFPTVSGISPQQPFQGVMNYTGK